MSYAIVDELREQTTVTLLCGALGVSASGYYAWRGRAPSIGIDFSPAISDSPLFDKLMSELA